MEKAIVYFTRDISAAGLRSVYDAMGIKLKGNVGGENFHRRAGRT